jgi:carboxymethylenebutenolidase
VATSEGPMDVHVFLPDAGGRPPAVIVLQEAFGVNPHMKRVCRRVASAGFAAFCPELFHRTGRGLEFGYDEFPRIKPIMGALTNARILEDLAETHRHVAARADTDPSRIAAWGFCMGGWASVLAACALPLRAAAAFYPGGLVHPRPGIGFTPLVGQLESVKCPLLLVYGGTDAGIPQADVDAVSNRLTALGKEHEVEVYPEGGHGFCCEDRSSYHHDSAEAAWARATAWLRARLA